MTGEAAQETQAALVELSYDVHEARKELDLYYTMMFELRYMG